MSLILKEIDRQTFECRFGDNKSSYKFLPELKWPEGYCCTHCVWTAYIKGKQPSSRRCSKCGYDESVIIGAISHKLKLELCNAIGILYDTVTSKKWANKIWLSKRYEVNQKMAWLFSQKVQFSMEISRLHPLGKRGSRG